MKIFAHLIILNFITITLTSCFLDSGGSSPPNNTFTINGTINGLVGSGLVLQNNGGDDLSISTDGSFTFVTALPDGSDYSVSAVLYYR